MAMVVERDKSDERSCPNGGGRRCVTSMMSARQHLATRPKLGRLLITHVSANTPQHKDTRVSPVRFLSNAPFHKTSTLAHSDYTMFKDIKGVRILKV